MVYVFLDTNIFLHFNDFEQIDWPTLLNTKDKIIITFAPIVIDELDKHKYNKNQKISRRAKKLLAKIEQFIETPSLSSYEIKFISTRPSDSTFIASNLDRKEQDDSLLATIKEFSSQIVSDDKIVYVTNDVGPRLKSRTLNIETYKPSDEYLLASEPDETEQQNISLKKELNELKIRIPKVSLVFKNESNLISFKKEKFDYTKEEFILEKVKQNKSDYPYLKSADKDLYKNPGRAFASPLDTISDSQLERYNEELKKYYDDFENYIESMYNAFDFTNHSIELNLIIANNGTAPANDIDIEIHFPDGFELLSEDYLPTVNKKPKPPYKPKNSFDYEPMSLGSFFKPAPSVNLDNLNSSHPTIKKSNSYDVSYHVRELKHNQTFELEPLYARFIDIYEAKGFSIDYNLKISNVPTIIPGILNVKFEV